MPYGLNQNLSEERYHVRLRVFKDLIVLTLLHIKKALQQSWIVTKRFSFYVLVYKNIKKLIHSSL